MATFCSASHVKASVHKQPIPQGVAKLKTLLSSTVMPLIQELENTSMKIDVSKTIKNASVKVLDALVDSVFQFVDQPLIPSQRNFAPVGEIGEIVPADCVEGQIPPDFPEGVYIRNGANPLFGLKSTVSVLGRTNEIWVEGDGMLHALYFTKDSSGNWSFAYNNKFVESDTFKMEKRRNKPAFLPGIEGDSLAILAAPILNSLRFGLGTKILSNTSIFEQAGKYYSVTENYLPQEIDITSLETLGNWDIDGAWDRAFTSHPKKDPATGEMVIMGVEPVKPYYIVGVISADGKTLNHKVDINLNRSILPHEMGITEKYNIILDHPLIMSVDRLLQGGQFIKYEKDKYTRIGVMPRYGDVDSIQWFDVESHCMFHMFNCFEDGDEVVVRGCKANAAIIPGPDWGVDKLEWFSKAFKPINSSNNEANGNDSTTDGLLFSRVYEWRLNMETGVVKERYLSGTDLSMDFPTINGAFTGLKHKYGYAQVIDSVASSTCGKSKYGGLAKLHFEEPNSSSPSVEGQLEKLIKVEYHKFAKNNFCTGSIFVSKPGAIEEDDGWIVAFVHDEDIDVSHVIVVDAKRLEDVAVAKISLPQRVPYGHHGAYFAMPRQN